jgi:hypothetical protein
MEYVLQDYNQRVKKARGEWYWERRNLIFQERVQRLVDSDTPILAHAMKVAGVGGGWPTR